MSDGRMMREWMAGERQMMGDGRMRDGGGWLTLGGN